MSETFFVSYFLENTSSSERVSGHGQCKFIKPAQKSFERVESLPIEGQIYQTQKTYLWKGSLCDKFSEQMKKIFVDRARSCSPKIEKFFILSSKMIFKLLYSLYIIFFPQTMSLDAWKEILTTTLDGYWTNVLKFFLRLR